MPQHERGGHSQIDRPVSVAMPAERLAVAPLAQRGPASHIAPDAAEEPRHVYGLAGFGSLYRRAVLAIRQALGADLPRGQDGEGSCHAKAGRSPH